MILVSRFAAGRGTALVVDVGSHHASVVPVVDGFVLRKGKEEHFFIVSIFSFRLN